MKKVIIVLFVCFLTACITEKSMIKNYSSLDFTVYIDNKFHQEHGRLPFQIKVHFPAKYFHNNSYLILQPYFEINKKKHRITRFLALDGEKVKDCNWKVSTQEASDINYMDTLDIDETGIYALFLSVKINDKEMPTRKLISFRK